MYVTFHNKVLKRKKGNVVEDLQPLHLEVASSIDCRFSFISGIEIRSFVQVSDQGRKSICPYLPNSPVSLALYQMLVGVGWGVCCSQENKTLEIAVKTLYQTIETPGPGMFLGEGAPWRLVWCGLPLLVLRGRGWVETEVGVGSGKGCCDKGKNGVLVAGNRGVLGEAQEASLTRRPGPRGRVVETQNCWMDRVAQEGLKNGRISFSPPPTPTPTLLLV